MKKIFLSTLALTMLIANIAQANPETPSFFQKAKNIAMNTFSDIANSPKTIATNAANTLSKIGDSTFNLMHQYPFISACLVAPLVPTKIAPFRNLAIHQWKSLPANSPLKGISLFAGGCLAALTGITARANLFHMFSHQYLKENKVEHTENKNPLLLSKKCSSCNPKIERTK